MAIHGVERIHSQKRTEFYVPYESLAAHHLRPAARRPEGPRAGGAGEGGGGGEPRVDSALLAHRAGDFAGAEGGGLGHEGRRAAGEGSGGGVSGDGRVFAPEFEKDARVPRSVGTHRNCPTAR